jgi:crotonobetainyl-CoA:carnitine CoA-transferase CaiB-like acyl-CoA transferase
VEHFAGLQQRSPFAELEVVEPVVHPVTGTRDCLRVPVRIDGRAVSTRMAAPIFDQHTDAVLRDWLSLGPDSIAELRRTRVVGTMPSAPGDAGE